MADYNLYFIDRQNHIRRAVRLEADCDVSAISLAEEHLDWGVLELWERGRPVVRLEHGQQLPIAANVNPKTP